MLIIKLIIISILMTWFTPSSLQSVLCSCIKIKIIPKLSAIKNPLKLKDKNT